MHGIVTDESFELEKTNEYILSIQASLDGFSFSVISPEENRLLAWKNTPVTITNEQFLPRRFKEWTDNEEITEKKFKETRIIIDTKEFVTVPDRYYQEDKKNELTEPIINIGKDSEIVTNKIDSQNLWLLFTISSQFKKMLSEQFQNLKIFHPLKNCLENLPQINVEANRLIVLFSSKYFYLILFKEQKLLFVNSFNLSHKNDVLFYILSALKHFRVNPVKTAVSIAGLITEEDQIIEKMKKYFFSVLFLQPANKLHINKERFYEPEHRLYNLVNLIK